MVPHTAGLSRTAWSFACLCAVRVERTRALINNSSLLLLDCYCCCWRSKCHRSGESSASNYFTATLQLGPFLQRGARNNGTGDVGGGFPRAAAEWLLGDPAGALLEFPTAPASTFLALATRPMATLSPFATWVIAAAALAASAPAIAPLATAKHPHRPRHPHPPRPAAAPATSTPRIPTLPL